MRTRMLGVIATVTLAVIGSVVLIAYVRGADDRALADVRTMDVLVVTEPIAEGTAADELADSVAVESVPAKVVASGAVSSLGELAGHVAAVDLEAGEQVLAGRFADPAELAAAGQVEIPDGLQRVTVALEPQRALGGQVRPGDTVGVFVSLSDGAADDDGEGDGDATTHQVLHKVLVTEVQFDGGEAGAPTESDAEGDDAPRSAPAPPGGSVLVTVAADAGDAERIVFGAEHGTVWLSAEPEGASESGTRVQSKETIYR